MRRHRARTLGRALSSALYERLDACMAALLGRYGWLKTLLSGYDRPPPANVSEAGVVRHCHCHHSALCRCTHLMATATNSARTDASHRCRLFLFSLFFSVFPFFRFSVFPFFSVPFFLCSFPFPSFFLLSFSLFLRVFTTVLFSTQLGTIGPGPSLFRLVSSCLSGFAHCRLLVCRLALYRPLLG